MKIKLNQMVPVVGFFLGALLATQAQQLGGSTSSGTSSTTAGTVTRGTTGATPAATTRNATGSVSSTSAGPTLGAIERSQTRNGVIPGNGAVGPGVTTALPTPSATPKAYHRIESNQRDNRGGNGTVLYPDAGTVVTPGTVTPNTTTGTRGAVNNSLNTNRTGTSNATGTTTGTIRTTGNPGTSGGAAGSPGTGGAGAAGGTGGTAR